MLKDCGELVRHVDDNFSEKTNTYGGEWCLGYMEGFVDSLDVVEMVESTDYADYKSHSRTQICFPDSSTIGQDVRVVVKFLQDHPEKLHERRKLLTYSALQKAFPCRTGPVKEPTRPK